MPVWVQLTQAKYLTTQGIKREYQPGDWVQVIASPHTGRFVRLHDRAYFYSTLMERLGLRNTDSVSGQDQPAPPLGKDG